MKEKMNIPLLKQIKNFRFLILCECFAHLIRNLIREDKVVMLIYSFIRINGNSWCPN
jgi:hypothetical protein